MDQNYGLDNLDFQILNQLMQDGRKSYTDIAKELFVSPGTIHVRMRKMESLHIVKGTSIIIDPAKLGFDFTAFIGIYLEKGSIYHDVIKELEKIPEITEAYYTTGQYSIFAKVVCKNTQHMLHVLNEFIQPINGIQRTETIISLEESIKRQVQLQ